MSTKKPAVAAAKKTKATKKQLLTELVSKLEAALTELKEELGEKKFGRRLKKAGKLLLHGLDNKPANTRKKASTGNKTTKKAAKPAAKPTDTTPKAVAKKAAAPQKGAKKTAATKS